ncbi:MAG: hypothetical protein JJLCMIEE_00403 [Acidimicrobiales bacterium]|nr:MAG: thioredoxin [Actinomycetota bacterium]MBV6507359.1 hypothetical protein [Acidimicrobiales bacterium]RIK04488.1 MAG: hypothetical protein DCC48_13250 [Acidobacteriota bacterium]
MSPLLLRLLVVALLVVVMAFVALIRRRQSSRSTLDGQTRLPDDLVGGSPVTWIVFTTPYCVSCDAVAEMLRADDPAAWVRVTDVSERPDLVRELGIRRAPTTLLADTDGRIRLKLVGLEAVREHLHSPAA